MLLDFFLGLPDPIRGHLVVLDFYLDCDNYESSEQNQKHPLSSGFLR